MRIFYLQIFIKCASFIYQGEKKAEMSIDHAVDERFSLLRAEKYGLPFPTSPKAKSNVIIAESRRF